VASGDEKIQIDITAKDDASKKIDEVAESAEALEKLAPEVEITADTDAAKSDIAAVDAAATELTRSDRDLIIRAKIDQAKGDLKTLEAELDDVGAHAKDAGEKLDHVDSGGGSGLRGNAIADLTGPLGDASGAASDFGGVFDGLGDTIQGVAGKMGASAETAEKLGESVAGFGFIVAAGAAAWTLFRQRQEAAKKAAQEAEKAQRDLNSAIRDGDREAAAANFAKVYGDALKAADTLGLSTEDIVKHITGQKDALQDVQQWIGNAYAGDTLNKVINAKNTVEELRQKWIDSNGAVKDADKVNGDIADALGLTKQRLDTAGSAATQMGRDVVSATDKAKEGFENLNSKISDKRAIEDWKQTMIDAQTAVHDKNKDTVVDIRAVEDAIVHAAEVAGLTPIQTQAIVDVAQDDVDKAFFMMQSMIDARGPLNANLKIHPELPPRLKIVTRGGTTILDEALVPISSAAVAPTGNSYVTVNMPHGTRQNDVARAVGVNGRRNGRRYGVVNYARR